MPVIDLGSVVGPQGPQGATGATGAQGIQGNPGPNQVTDQTSTNLNGVLFGNQSRVTVKPIDSNPTADSTNLVSSGGVKAALDLKQDKSAVISKKYLFVGDSYSVLSSNWVDFCAQYLGLSANQYVNAGVSGTGFIVDANGNMGDAYNGFLDCIQAVTEGRDTYTDVVICGGINDAQYDTFQSFLVDHIKNTISYIKANFPNATPHIGFIGGALENSPVLYGRTLPRRKLALKGYIVSSSPYYLNGVENAIHQSTYCYGSDGLHPNATGSELIGWAVAQAIQNGAVDIYQDDSLHLTLPSPWTGSGEDVTFTFHNDTAQLVVNNADYIISTSSNQTYNRSSGLTLTLPNNLRVNKRYSQNNAIVSLATGGSWELVTCEFVLYGGSLTMYPIKLSSSGYADVTTKLLSIVGAVVFDLRSEDIN